MTAWPHGLRRWIGAALLFATTVRADFRVVGSDLLGLDFTTAFYGFSGKNRLKLALALDGSRPGLEALKAGRADLAVVVLPPAEVASLAAFQTVAFGNHVIVVLVSALCPLEKISVAQLARAFSADGRRAADAQPMRWSDLGVAGEWGNSAVRLVLPEEGAGLVADLFRVEVLKGRALRSSVQRFSRVTDLAAELAGDSRALALAPATPVGVTAIKTLPVADREAGPAVAPSAEMVHAGRYPLRLPVQLVFRSERAAALGPLFDFLLSDEAADLLSHAGLVPVPAAERSKLLREMSGKTRVPR